LSQIYRLNSLWEECGRLANHGNLIAWNWRLDTIWRELSTDAEDKDFDEIKKINNEIGENKKDKEKLYPILNKKEIFLRKLQNKQGKGSEYYDPLEDEMD